MNQPLPRNNFVFQCSRQQEVSAFCDMLTSVDGVLSGVLKAHQGLLMGGLFLIVYERTEELEMEVLT